MTKQQKYFAQLDAKREQVAPLKQEHDWFCGFADIDYRYNPVIRVMLDKAKSMIEEMDVPVADIEALTINLRNTREHIQAEK